MSEIFHYMQFLRPGTYVLGVRYLFEGLTKGYGNISFEPAAYTFGDARTTEIRDAYGEFGCGAFTTAP